MAKVVLIDYTTAWCGPCRIISPILDKLAAEADSYRIEFYKVDVDNASAIVQKAGMSVVCLHYSDLSHLLIGYTYSILLHGHADAYFQSIQLEEPGFPGRLCTSEGSHPHKTTGVCIYYFVFSDDYAHVYITSNSFKRQFIHGV